MIHKKLVRVPRGYWFYVEVMPFSTDVDLQRELYHRCGMDLSLDRIDIREDLTGKARYWRAVVSLEPAHVDQMANFCLDAENLRTPIFFLPFPKQQKSEAIREPIRQETTA